MKRHFFYCMFVACAFIGSVNAGGDADRHLAEECQRLQKERDAFAARAKQLQAQLDESRKTLDGIRLDLAALQDKYRALLDATKTGKLLPGKHDNPATEKQVARGTITAIGNQGRLMQISIGSSSGIRNGQTLEVYRVANTKGKNFPLYLGSVKVVRIETQVALGEFKAVPGLEDHPRVGDVVATEFIFAP